VDTARFSDIESDGIQQIKNKLNITDQKIVSYIGTLSLVNHPVELLINAFVHIKKELPNSLLLIVGGGQDYEALVEITSQLSISKYVKFCGRVSPDEVPYYYKISDVVVDPVIDNAASRGRVPLKMFESWISGVPFVTGDVGDRKLLLGDPPAGLIVKPGDHTSLSEGILELIKNPQLTETIRTSGYKNADYYNWQRTTRILEATYSNVKFLE
jgi:glycosyltransferase involved in cell wall biosynthesis